MATDASAPTPEERKSHKLTLYVRIQLDPEDVGYCEDWGDDDPAEMVAQTIADAASPMTAGVEFLNADEGNVTWRLEVDNEWGPYDVPIPEPLP